MPLTDAAIRNAKSGEKPKKLFDGGVLYLEVAPAGGKEKRLSLGVYPDVTLKDARERRDQARKILANGTDPSENRKAMKAARVGRAANSFEVVAPDWFAKHSPNQALRVSLVKPGAFLSTSKFQHNNKGKALCLPGFPSCHGLKHPP
jgi:hypothetical protein